MSQNTPSSESPTHPDAPRAGGETPTNPPVPATPLDVEACVRPDIPWRCFHCDETFTDADAAREHFGVDEGQVAGCILKLNEGERLLLGTIRELEQENRDLLQRAQEAEMEHETDAGLRAELKRYFGHSDAWSCWQELDAMKGRALAAEEIVERLLAAANAPAAEYLCDRVDALASALPGMGKKADWYDWLAEEDHVDWTRRLGNGNFAVETPPFGMKPDIERATLGECIAAARAAQPEETSADG